MADKEAKQNKTEEINEKENEEENKESSKNNYNTYSEIISKTIIEKIISLSSTRLYCNEIYQRIGDHCFNYIKKEINPYLKILYFSYEIDTNENKEDKIFFDEKISNNNDTWIEIKEPETPIIDRFSIDKMKFEPFITITQEKIIEDEKEKKIRKKKEIEKNEEKKEEKKVRKENENEGKDGPWIDLPSYELPKEAYYNKYVIKDSSPEINELRKEMEMEIQRKEKQRLIEEEEKRKARLKELNFRIVREFDSNRLTFDPNGNIINLRINNNIESNLGNEFYWSKPSVKENKVFRHLFLKPLRKSFNHLQRKKDNKIEEIIEEKEKGNNKKRKSFSNKKSAEDILGENIIRNPNNYDEKYFNRIMKIKEQQNENLSIPSGQNFDKIIPEVGVKILSEDKKKKKEGGYNFSEKFKRPTYEQFSKLAIETENLNNSLKLYSQNYHSTKNLLNNNNLSSVNNLDNDNNNNNNYIGYKKEFNLDNPLIQNAHSNLDNINNKINNNNLEQKSELSSKLTIQSYSYLGNSFRNKLLTNEITINKNLYNSNLRNVFRDTSTDNYNSYDISNQYKKSVRPIGTYMLSNKLRKKNLMLPEIKVINGVMIDKFNSNIVKNKNWGNDNESNNIQSYSFIKPHKSNHIRELSHKIKLPRERKLIINEDSFQKNKLKFINLSMDKIRLKKNDKVIVNE